MSRFLMWVAEQRLTGWSCSECEWTYPLPPLLSNAEARSAFDRLAAAKFEDHECSKQPKQMRLGDGQTFAERARKLILRGFKPKDAVELTLQEIEFEHRNEKKIIEQARADAQQFLQKVREGLI
jgi:hypothetical protein